MRTCEPRYGADSFPPDDAIADLRQRRLGQRSQNNGQRHQLPGCGPGPARLAGAVVLALQVVPGHPPPGGAGAALAGFRCAQRDRLVQHRVHRAISAQHLRLQPRGHAWTWRVQLYAFTLSTDRYPPFALGSAPDFPGEIDVAYPEQLSRGKVWVKSWLLAIPHLVLLAIFDGGSGTDIGLIGLLCLIAGVHLAVKREYPASVFDLVIGLHRRSRPAALLGWPRPPIPPNPVAA